MVDMFDAFPMGLASMSSPVCRRCTDRVIGGLSCPMERSYGFPALSLTAPCVDGQRWLDGGEHGPSFSSVKRWVGVAVSWNEQPIQTDQPVPPTLPGLAVARLE